MPVKISEAVNRRFDELGARESYLAIKKRTEAQVTQWRWATAEKFQLGPFDAEKNRLPKGRWLNSEPAVTHYQYLHGIDAYGRIVVIRRMSEFPGVFAEEFFTYSKSMVESAYYSSASSSVSDNPSATRESVIVAHLHLDAGLPVRYEIRRMDSTVVADYVHVDGRLVTEHLINDCTPWRKRCLDLKYNYHYDTEGRLALIECVSQDLALNEAPEKHICYRRPKKGQSKKELSIRIASLAARSIPETLRAAGIREKVFNLLIVYDNENFPLPPMLALGSETLRQRARQEHGKNAKYEIWNPADYQYFNIPVLELKDPALLEACDLLNQQMAESDNCQPGRQLLNSVAAQLQQFDWTGILQTTDDFVVCAIDLESQDDLQKNIKKSVPPELLKQLKREGLL